MKQQGQCIVGDVIKVDDYTSDWMQIQLHPTTFYRRYDQFSAGFDLVKGLYAELDLGSHISVRFTNKEDMTEFHRLHHAYL